MAHPIVTDLETIASSTAAENGFDLCGVQVFTHLKPMTMQVQIRQAGGGDVSLEDCARFSGPMGEAIDTSKILDEAYVLEISSPGIDGQLLTDRDFKTFRGFPIKVSFRDEKNIELNKAGLLHQRSADHLHLNIKGKIIAIPRNNVIEVSLTSPTG